MVEDVGYSRNMNEKREREGGRKGGYVGEIRDRREFCLG